MSPQEQVRNKCKEVAAIAQRLYGVDLSQVNISFNLKGGVAGWASWKRRLGVMGYACKFNADMLLRGDPETLDNMINTVVPHELAHIVCYMKPSLGKNHDSGWQMVDRSLGGTGKRTHDMEVVKGRGNTYEYTTDRNKTVRVGERIHRMIVSGVPVPFRKGLGTVRQGCAYSIVGVNGQTLKTPIVKQAVAVNHPATIETFVRGRIDAFVRERMHTQQTIHITDLTGDAPKHSTMVLKPVQLPPAARPVVVPGRVLAPVVAVPAEHSSKAAKSRWLMTNGMQRGLNYEEIIQAMMLANGYDRQLARATFKANQKKVGIPDTFV